MTKKLIVILAAVVLMLSFAACKSNEDDKQGPSASDASSQYDNIVVGDYGDDNTGSENTFSEDNLNDADVESLWQQMNPTTEIN